MPAHRLLAAIAASAFLLAAPSARAGGYLTSSSSCSNSTTVDMSWTMYDDGNGPAHPEWVGYDILRRSARDCGSWIRVNATTIPRVVGQTHSLSYSDTPPSAGTMYQYRVALVTAGHAALAYPLTDCDCYMGGFSWASCPDFSAPIFHGFVEDVGWTVRLSRCDNTCYDYFYVEGNVPDGLRAYDGTGTAVAVYGSGGCSSFEGCYFFVDHFEPAACGIDPTPARPTSWGRVKTIYR